MTVVPLHTSVVYFVGSVFLPIERRALGRRFFTRTAVIFAMTTVLFHVRRRHEKMYIYFRRVI